MHWKICKGAPLGVFPAQEEGGFCEEISGLVQSALDRYKVYKLCARVADRVWQDAQMRGMPGAHGMLPHAIDHVFRSAAHRRDRVWVSDCKVGPP